MRIGYHVARASTAEELKKNPTVVYFSDRLIKQGAEEVVVDTLKHELLPDLLDRLQSGDSMYLSDILHLSQNRQRMQEILKRLQDININLFVNGDLILYTDPRIQVEIDHLFDVRDERVKEIKAGMDYVAQVRLSQKTATQFKELRQQSGMTQKAYADYFDIPQRTIENWEGGQRLCPEYVLQLMQYKLKNEGIIK